MFIKEGSGNAQGHRAIEKLCSSNHSFHARVKMKCSIVLLPADFHIYKPMTATWDDGWVILYTETLIHNQLQDFTPTTPGSFPLSQSQRQPGCKKFSFAHLKRKKCYVVSRKSKICLICIKQLHLIHIMAVVISVSQHTVGKCESSPLIWYLNSITVVQA